MPDTPLDMGASPSATGLSSLRDGAAARLHPDGLQSHGARTRVYRPVSFDAFRVTDGRTYPVRLACRPGTLQAAVDAAVTAQLFCHKEHLVIRETGEDGAVKLHLFAIKRQSRPTYEYRDYQHHRVHRHYTEPLCILDGAILGVGAKE